MRQKVKLRVPGSTSNLGSGFDTFGLALKLYLNVEVEIGQSADIEISGEGSAEIATDESNLILKSFRTFFDKFDLAVPDVKIRVQNEIPLQRGLGSSGAATIAGLMAAAVLSGADLSNETLLQMAAEIEGHPENASASLLGGLTVNVQQESGLLTRKIHVDKALTGVLFIPEKRISTQQAREILPEEVPHADAVFNTQRSALLAHAFLSQDYLSLRTAMQDRLHQPFRKQLIPGFEKLAAAGYDRGALGICISGSGSAVLAITFKEKAKAVIKAWQSVVTENGTEGRVIGIECENTGACRL